MSAVEKAFRSSCDRRHAGKDLLGDGVKSRVKGGEGIARSSTRLLRAILNWGCKSGSVEWDAVQAARNVQIGRDGPRDVILEDPAVHARLRATLDGMVTPVFAGHDQVRHQQSAGCLLSCVALNRVRRRNLETFTTDCVAGIVDGLAGTARLDRGTPRARPCTLWGRGHAWPAGTLKNPVDEPPEP